MDTKKTKICTEMPPVDFAASLTAAIKERPDNLALDQLRPEIVMSLNEIEAPMMAVLYQKMWRTGRTLGVSYIGGVDPTVRTKIERYAKEWEQYANIKFDFTAEEGDIRISTEPGGSWSYLGTDAATIPSGNPTMNYGWLRPETDDDEYSRVVIHEFGHALGAVHEHQHPSGGIPWDRPKVYAYYAKQGWDQQMVDTNVFGKYSMDQLNTGAYDRDSIMHYAVPNDLTIGDWEIGWNTVLSQHDKALIRKVYP